MRLGWLAIPALFLLGACSDPAASYRKAAHQLTFTLDRVDSTVHLAYPVEQSRLVLHLTVGAQNPTEVRFQARSISGHVTLESDGATYAIGELSAVQGLDLKPLSRTPVAMDLAITYADLKQAWGSLRMVSQGARPGTWKLDGQVGMEVLGFPVTAPLHVQKRASGQ
jgi:hypothetical protein